MGRHVLPWHLVLLACQVGPCVATFPQGKRRAKKQSEITHADTHGLHFCPDDMACIRACILDKCWAVTKKATLATSVAALSCATPTYGLDMCSVRRVPFCPGRPHG